LESKQEKEKSFIKMAPHNKEILINNNSLLKDITGAFTSCYPFLKMEFPEIDKGPKTLRRPRLDPRTSLYLFQNISTPLKIDINGNRTVSEVIHHFKNLLGIVIQISRKSGNVWNAISVTDGWSLENQNSAGEFISSEMNILPIKAGN
jgi:hypothetical protein